MSVNALKDLNHSTSVAASSRVVLTIENSENPREKTKKSVLFKRKIR